LDDKISSDSAMIIAIGIIAVCLVFPIFINLANDFTSMEITSLNGSVIIVKESIDSNVMMAFTMLIPIFAVIGIFAYAIHKAK